MRAFVLSLGLFSAMYVHGQSVTDSVYAIHQVDSIPVIYFDNPETLPNRCVSNPDCGSGTVFVSFVLNRNGSVSDICPILAGSLSDCCTQEIRNLLLQIQFKPAILHGNPVSVRMEIPVYMNGNIPNNNKTRQ